jgi:hypothetical protein
MNCFARCDFLPQFEKRDCALFFYYSRMARKTLSMRVDANGVFKLTMLYFRGNMTADQLEFLQKAMTLYGDLHAEEQKKVITEPS